MFFVILTQNLHILHVCKLLSNTFVSQNSGNRGIIEEVDTLRQSLVVFVSLTQLSPMLKISCVRTNYTDVAVSPRSPYNMLISQCNG